MPRRWRIGLGLMACAVVAGCSDGGSGSSEGADDASILEVGGYYLLVVLAWIVGIAIAFAIIVAIVLGVVVGVTRAFQWAWSGSKRT